MIKTTWDACGGAMVVSKTDGPAAPAPPFLSEAADSYMAPAPAWIGQTWTRPLDGAVMVAVPAGEFTMGDDGGCVYGIVENAKPQHTVYLSAYWIDKNDITVAQYLKFCDATGREAPDPDFQICGVDYSWRWGNRHEHPIVNVTWDDARAYCDWAGATLPTEAQWEKAARGTDGRKYPWGNDWDASRLWCSADGARGIAGGTARVGSFLRGASPYGCLDMAGSIWRWCADWYDPDYYKRSPDQNPNGAKHGNLRVLRGGSWYNNAANLFRCAYRDMYTPGYSDGTIGFRCAVRGALHADGAPQFNDDGRRERAGSSVEPIYGLRSIRSQT